MSFISPIFLWLIPLTAIPIILHLYNRRNIINIDFSTLRFLSILEKKSMQKLKLLQIFLLILRSIIILLIISMITRPIIEGAFNNHTSDGSTLHAVILDDSFSVQGNINIIYKSAKNILDQIPDKAQLIWININKGIQFDGIKENMPPLENLLTFTFHSGNIKNGLNILKHYIEDDYISKEIYILTDSQYESFYDYWEHSEYFDDMNLYTFITPQITNNLAITNVRLITEILIPNHPISLEVTIKNNGSSDVNSLLLQLIIDNVSVGQQLVSVSSDDEKLFIFQTTLSNSGTYLAKVQLNSDNKIPDNKFYFILNMPDQLNVAIISQSREESYYIRASMESLNHFGKSLSISEYTSFDDENIIINKQDAIFIFSPNELSKLEDSKLEDFLYQGGHIIIFPSNAPAEQKYSYINRSFPDINDNYDHLKLYDFSDNSFQDISLTNIKIEEISNLFFSNSENDRNIKIFKYIKIPYNPKYSQFILNDGNAIWNRYNVNHGMIDIFGFAINLNWTNFPIKGTFIPFINYLTYSKYLDENNLYEIVGNNWTIIVKNHFHTQTLHIQPSGSREIINPDENNYFMTDILKEPGFHNIETQNIIISQSAVNVEQDELNSNNTSIKILQNNAPDNMKIISMKSDVAAEIIRAGVGTELWRYILYTIIILLIIEMLISNIQRKN